MGPTDQLQAGIQKDEALYGQRQGELLARQNQISADRERALSPMEEKLSREIAQPLPQKPKVDLPEFKPQPLIPAKDYESLSYGLIAMAMIGGVASKGQWLGVGATLNGALQGYLKGNQLLAEKHYEDYLREFQSAKAKEDQANREFETILKNKQLRISDQIQQYRLVAAKYDRQDALAAAQSRSLDAMWRSLESRKTALARLEEHHDTVRATLAAKQGQPLTQEQLNSSAGQIAAGMPLTQVVPGYGQAAVTQRQQARQAGIEQIKRETGLDDVGAGIELARRQADFVSGKSSVQQLTKMRGATEQALRQLDFNVQKVSESMDKLPSSDLSPVINALARGVEKWAGDPAYSELFFYMHAAGMESARILQGGQASIAQLHQGAAEEAKKWADANFTTPKAWKEGVAPAMIAESKARLESYDKAIETQRGRIGHGGAQPGPSALPPGWSVEVH